MEYIAWLGQTINSIYSYWELSKQYLRSWLGPEPMKLYILKDGSVLPSTLLLPTDMEDEAYIFCPNTNQITSLQNPTPEGRFRPLPYIGIQFNAVSNSVDISDWLGEIRANPIPPNITVEQIVRVWMFVHNRYISLKNTKAHIVKNDGTEEDFTFE